ncbi:unnamed protein product, partial [Mesorhabditis spiculigera]
MPANKSRGRSPLVLEHRARLVEQAVKAEHPPPAEGEKSGGKVPPRGRSSSADRAKSPNNLDVGLLLVRAKYLPCLDCSRPPCPLVEAAQAEHQPPAEGHKRAEEAPEAAAAAASRSPSTGRSKSPNNLQIVLEHHGRLLEQAAKAPEGDKDDRKVPSRGPSPAADRAKSPNNMEIVLEHHGRLLEQVARDDRDRRAPTPEEFLFRSSRPISFFHHLHVAFQKGDRVLSVLTGNLRGKPSPPYLYKIGKSQELTRVQERRLLVRIPDVLEKTLEELCICCDATDIYIAKGPLKLCRKCWDSVRGWTGVLHRCDPNEPSHQENANNPFSTLKGDNCLECKTRRAVQHGWSPIRIGHIGAVNTMPNYEKVLELSRQELLADGTFGDDFDVEVINKNGCGDAFEGVAAAADMYHVDKVMAFLGPYCNSEMVPVATMAAYWNKPIIAYMATSNALADKKIYKTLARVSIRTINTQAEATGAFIRHYKWRKVAFVTNAGAAAYEKIVAFEKVFRRMGVNVVKKIVFDETATAQDMISSGQIDEIKTTSRIVIALFSSVRDLTTEFRKATEASGLSTSEYVFVFPSIQEGANGASPFVGSSNDMLDAVKKNYANCILIDDVNGFDDRLMTPFLERLSAIGLGAEDIDLKNIYGYISLYDSMKIFGLAGRRVLEATKNFSEITNGKRMFDTMRRMTFSGMASVAGSGSGTVLLDDQAERLPFYSAFYVSAERNRVLSICNITPSLMPASKCSKEEDNPGCVDIVSSPLGYKLQPQSPTKDTFQVSDVQSGFWNSVGGQMPIDEPACGFRGEK